MKLPRTPSFRLDGKTALVAGASSGIGLGAAVALAEAGAHVVCAARNESKLKDVVAAIGSMASVLVMDITNIDEMSQKLRALKSLDVFVNSTGLAKHSPALETRPDDFDHMMNVNWRAAHFAAREAAKLKMEKVDPSSPFHQRCGA
jgi:NAD(P)-dependent dehydrogenase (short-subunit alcohol dehydrogenase family)